MSGTHHLYTKSGRPMPPPPKTTPRRRASVCRTPTRRYGSLERRSSPIFKSRSARREPHDLQLLTLHSEQKTSPDGRTPGRFRAVLEDPTQARRWQRTEQMQPTGIRSFSHGKDERLQGGWREATPIDNHGRIRQLQWEGGNDRVTMSAVNSRSISQQGSEYYDPRGLTVRLRRSLSRGYSPSRRRPSQAVVGTELMAPMPRLQGAHRTSKNRDRMTIQRFIQCQPLEAQKDMWTMVEEYKGREDELCQALSEAYAESWDSAVRGNETFGQTQSSVDSKKNGPLKNWKKDSDSIGQDDNKEIVPKYQWQGTLRPIQSAHSLSVGSQENHGNVSRHQSNSDFATPQRGKYVNLPTSLGREEYEEEVSPQLRQGPGGRVGTVLEHPKMSPHSGGMLTPSVPEDLFAR